ncbi:MAG: SRPBCC family protein [Cyclobacteriaceae bacterium]
MTATQVIPASLEETWSIFSNPQNLSKITPAHMGFEITSEPETKTYAGQIITYRLGVLPGIKTNWVTEITKVIDGKMFIDEQRFGPYAMWHHEHYFEQIDENTTQMFDKVAYKVPFGSIGELLNKPFIQKQVASIFSYREKAIEQFFD